MKEQSMFDRLQAMKPTARKSFLSDNAYKIVEGKHLRKFTEDELADKREGFTKGAMEVADLQDEFKEIKADYSGRIKEKNAKQVIALTEIRQKGTYVTGETYYFDDQEAGRMYVYDENGMEIENRKLRPDEKQTSVLTAQRGEKKG